MNNAFIGDRYLANFTSAVVKYCNIITNNHINCMYFIGINNNRLDKQSTSEPGFKDYVKLP